MTPALTGAFRATTLRHLAAVKDARDSRPPRRRRLRWRAKFLLLGSTAPASGSTKRLRRRRRKGAIASGGIIITVAPQKPDGGIPDDEASLDGLRGFLRAQLSGSGS